METVTNPLTEWERARQVARVEADRAKAALKMVAHELEDIVVALGTSRDSAWAREYVNQLMYATIEVGNVTAQFESDLGWAIEQLTGDAGQEAVA